MTLSLPFQHGALTFTLAVHLTNPLNGATGSSMLAQIIRSQKRAKHRKAASFEVLQALRLRALSAIDFVPAVVKLTRVSAGRMDDDGLAAACKGIRDGIAEALGVNDGGRFIQFLYDQRKGPQRVHAVEVLIVRAS